MGQADNQAPFPGLTTASFPMGGRPSLPLLDKQQNAKQLDCDYFFAFFGCSREKRWVCLQLKGLIEWLPW